MYDIHRSSHKCIFELDGCERGTRVPLPKRPPGPLEEDLSLDELEKAAASLKLRIYGNLID